MTKITKLLSIVLMGCLMQSCSNKKLDQQFGVNFNSIRKQNGIPILSSKWVVVNPFKTRERAWRSPSQKHGFVSKKIIIVNNKITSESDTYYSGKQLPITDLDHAGQNEAEYLVIRYFYDATGKKVKNIKAFTNAEESFNVSFDEAKAILLKWGIKIPYSDLATLSR